MNYLKGYNSVIEASGLPLQKEASRFGMLNRIPGVGNLRQGADSVRAAGRARAAGDTEAVSHLGRKGAKELGLGAAKMTGAGALAGTTAYGGHQLLTRNRRKEELRQAQRPAYQRIFRG